MKKKMNTAKKILILEGIFVLVVLAYVFFSTIPSQIYPLQGMAIKEPFDFKIKHGDEILISNDKNFTDFLVLKEGDRITLGAGKYFWKVRNSFRESEVMNFSVEGNVALDLTELNDSYELINSGNVVLNVTKIGEEKKASIIIDIGDSKSVEKDTNENVKFEGRQK
jgi:hypothetical protein